VAFLYASYDATQSEQPKRLFVIYSKTLEL